MERVGLTGMQQEQNAKQSSTRIKK